MSDLESLENQLKGVKRARSTIKAKKGSQEYRRQWNIYTADINHLTAEIKKAKKNK